MKRNIILIIILLLLTGCKIEYKINLNNNFDIEETAKLISTTTKDETEFNEFSLHIPIDKEADDYTVFTDKSDKLEYYNFKRINNTLQFGYKYKQSETEKYINSSFVNTAYDYISINKVNEETLVLSTSKDFRLFDRYPSIEEVKVTINTKYKVITNNADEVKRHNYTWIITKDNAYGKGIYLKLNPTKEDITFLEKLLRGDYLNIFTISLLILALGYIVFLILKRKSQKVDEF